MPRRCFCTDACGCKRGTHPATFTVVLAGIVSGSGSGIPEGFDWTTLNGSYVVTETGEGTCVWEYSWPATNLCPGTSAADNYLRLTVAKVAGGKVKLTARLRITTGCNTHCPTNPMQVCQYTWNPNTYKYVLTVNACPNAPGCSCLAPELQGLTQYQGDNVVLWEECYLCQNDVCEVVWEVELDDNACDVTDESVPLDSVALCSGYCSGDFSGSTCAVTANGPFV